MIVDKHGRTFSTRTKEEEDAFIQKELESLDSDERAALELMLQEMQGDQPSPAFELLQAAEYETTPVDMETFLMDPHYLGGTCAGLYPKLKVDINELFSGGYQEAIFTGSIGWGKTFLASIGVCRILYELSCMKDPQSSLGLAPGSNISLVCLSVNESLAMKVAFENIAVKVKASAYFEHHFPYKDTKKEFRFPKNVWLAARATTDSSVLGLNCLGGILDETNFMRKDAAKKHDVRFGPLDHAEVLYAGIKRRMRSRFEKRGRLPGMLFLVSSKKTHDDFTARRIRDSRNDPTIFVRDYALWDVKPADSYSSQTFHVLCGNENTPSKILDVEEGIRFQQAQDDDTLTEGLTLISVPEDFRFDFETNLEGAI